LLDSREEKVKESIRRKINKDWYSIKKI
jgi:hypothetical protein